MRFFGQDKPNTPPPVRPLVPKTTPAPTTVSQMSSIVSESTDDISSVMEQLSDEQQRVIEELLKGNSVVVDSCIGSGKTRVLQAVCNAFPHNRILYLTYNRLLKIDAQNRIKSRNATVQNYHGFVYKFLMRRGINVPPNEQIRAFLDRCSDVPLIYDIIAVDEYQDLSEDTVDLLLYIKKECPKAQWVFVGDMAQKIYDKTKVDVYKDCISKIIPDYVPLQFTKSFRISDGVAKYVGDLWEKKIVGANPNCEVSMVTTLGEVVKILDATPNKDCLVLGPRYGDTQALVNLLERHDPNKYNKGTLWTSISDRDDNFKIQPDSLIVTTYDGCKGMERPVCIVMDWTDTHYSTRVEKPFTDQQIITNLFCVAATRGKDKIVFYLPDKRGHILQKKDLTLSYTQDLPDFNPSSMFDFKHQADIDRCMSFLEVEDIPQEDTSEIEYCHADLNIDLAPVIGNYQELAFFKNYDFDSVVDSKDEDPITIKVKYWISRQPSLTAAQKALALTAIDTSLFRYVEQTEVELISPEMSERLMNRLATRLDPNNRKVQVPCHLIADFTSFGRMDYLDKDKIPTELKFVSALSPQNHLQTAMYILSIKAPYGYLWNTRKNELKKITVKDRDKFLEAVYSCITMGRKLRRH